MTKRLPIVYLPIEFGSREFDSKALLAVTLVQRGYAVVLGQQWMLYDNLRGLPPGVVLFKSFNNIHHGAMRIARKAAHKVVVLEEELLAHIEAKTIGNFCTKDIFSIPDLILANGKFEKQVLGKLSGGKVAIEVTGNGRIDILKPGYRGYFKKEIDAIRAKFGDFVLVNTNFGIINTLWDSVAQVTEIHVRAGFVKPEDPESVRAWNDQIEFEQLNKAAILAAVEDLCARRPRQKVVVRPHPSEALERWKGVFNDSAMVTVVREGAHVPWTLACQALMHTSCTTGFEAQVAGKMAFSIVPNPNWLSESMISNHLNPVFREPAKMVDAIVAYLEGGEDRLSHAPRIADPTSYVANYGDRSGVEQIAAALVREVPLGDPITSFPVLWENPRDARLKSKFTLSPEACVEALQRVIGIVAPRLRMNLNRLGDSLFLLNP